MIPKKPTFLVVTLLWLEELTAKTSKNTMYSKFLQNYCRKINNHSNIYFLIQSPNSKNITNHGINCSTVNVVKPKSNRIQIKMHFTVVSAGFKKTNNHSSTYSTVQSVDSNNINSHGCTFNRVGRVHS